MMVDLWDICIIICIYKKGNETDSSNYERISLLSTTYTVYVTFFCEG
jgi:hypothetical protein